MSHPRKRLALALSVITGLAVTATTMTWSPAAASTAPVTNSAATAATATAAALAPVNRRILDSRVTESSGLAHSTYRRNTLFTHNDSGDRPRVFAVRGNGTTKAVITLRGAKSYDWEDMSTGPNHTLWVGDTGDNARSRSSIQVYRFREPSALYNRTVKATRFRFVYPDGHHDSEGMMVHPRTGRVFIVSKQDRGAVYVAPRRLSTTKVNRLRKLRGAPTKVTSATFNPSGRGYAIGTYGSAYTYRTLTSRARKVSVPSRRQGESLEYNRTGGRLLAGSEGSKSPVYQVAARPAATSTVSSSRGCATAPAYTQAGTRFGTSLSTSGQTLAESVDDVESKFGPVPVVRTFDPTIPPDKAWSRRAPALGNKMIVASFREAPAEILSGKFDAKIRAWFQEAPDNTILYSYFHEADAEIAKQGSFTAAQFRAAFRHVVDIAASLCRDNLYPTLILTGWTASESSGRDWQDYYPGNNYVSVMSWDPYNSASSAPTRYADPTTLYADVLRESKEVGKPWGIAETGSARISGDASGVQRAAWLTKVGAYFDSKGAKYVTYFQSTRDQDFELRDQPSIDAWKAWIRRS
ncbi:glycoside hydrolase family 26 protein [Nocardioides jensenii]|uniref:hypothetical protein n=1 Tax=Nocardioides jensenii TaxID=1843 RepID=UPI000830D2B7|nr:hypothetical protein [Nocardioides jensenii]